MPVRKPSTQKRDAKESIRVAGLFIRRKAGKEFHHYISLPSYEPQDYEVLLRGWPSDPYKHHLGAFSGPVIPGEDPPTTLLQQSNLWSAGLAENANVRGARGIEGRRAVFMSVHGGGGRRVDPIDGKKLDLGIVLSYVVPVTHSDSKVVLHYPSSQEFPQFYDLDALLKGMIDGSLKIHPFTREMLAALDHWLREQHAVPGGVNSLFAPSVKTRLRMFVVNPLFDKPAVLPEEEGEEEEDGTPDSSVAVGPHPLLSSTPFSRLGEESTMNDTTGITASRPFNETAPDHQADKVVRNPLFGTGLQLEKVNRIVRNEHFGKGIPDYEAVSSKKGKWMVQVQGDGLPDWTELFPLHKFACEGDCDGVRHCIQLGMLPDERDTDSWSALHYACWYGELDVVRVLVEEASASIGIQNSNGSTPLHLAAATGHKEVVSFLLQQRGIHRIKAALDNDGKSALAVCLECRTNQWDQTAEILREAYKLSAAQSPSHGLLSFSPQPSASIEDLLWEGLERRSLLDHRGSREHVDTPSSASTKKNKKTLRRQRVSFMNGHHQLAHFFRGRDTQAIDVLQDIYRIVKLGREYHYLFALWIVSENLELQLGDTDKPLKLVSSWGQLLTQFQGKSSRDEPPSLYLRRNIFFNADREKIISDPVALEFLYADAHRHVLNGYYPCSEEDALYLAGIAMQISYGDHNEAVHRPGFLKGQLAELLPSHLALSKRRVEFERRVLNKHAEMSQHNLEDTKLLYVSYLKHCWQWPYYGSTFYNGLLSIKGLKLATPLPGRFGRKSQLHVSIGINTTGFHIFSREANLLLQSLPFEGLEWDVTAAKHELVLYRKDHSINILIHSRKVGLMFGLVTRIMEQYSGGRVTEAGSRTSITASA